MHLQYDGSARSVRMSTEKRQETHLIFEMEKRKETNRGFAVDYRRGSREEKEKEKEIHILMRVKHAILDRASLLEEKDESYVCLHRRRCRRRLFSFCLFFLWPFSLSPSLCLSLWLCRFVCTRK